MTVTAERVAAEGDRIAGSWIVERSLADVGGLRGYLARGLESGRAVLFILSGDVSDEVLDQRQAARWGTVRHVARDERFGRVVVDEIPEGTLLADRLARGLSPARGTLEDIVRRLREAHRHGCVHGQMAPDRIVLVPEGVAVAGWGLGGEDIEQRRARDLAWVSRLSSLVVTHEAGHMAGECGATGPAPTRDASPMTGLAAGTARALTAGPATGPKAERCATNADSTGPRPWIAASQSSGSPSRAGSSAAGAVTIHEQERGAVSDDANGPVATGPIDVGHRLHAAILSDHLPTLRAAVAEWDSAGGATDDATAVRARDAIARMERKIASSLEEARQRLAAGDPLGAVAPCREAVRLGAEKEAEPLLRQARRQARQMVSGPRRVPWRLIAVGSGIAFALALLVVAAVLALSPSTASTHLRVEIQSIAQRQGAREAIQHLLVLRERGQGSAGVDTLLSEWLPRIGGEERARLARLRREAVAQGARPRDPDRQAEEALARLAQLTAQGSDAPALKTRLQQVLLAIDRAAMLYRTSTRVSTAEAARAVDHLLAEDPLFAGGGQ